MMKKNEILFMKEALRQAHLAQESGEVPIGAVLVKDHKIIASSGNKIENNFDPTAHAEIQVLREAASILQEPRLFDCDVYVTLEPCPMCAQALSFARIRRVYFGAYDPKGGGIDHGPRLFTHSTCHWRPEVYGGLLEDSCGALLVDFFKNKRMKPEDLK